ncbi:hypothetical protein [Clostridium ljungdahlii]|uniref:Uncharacterized protein n=1 Tax=Clostridium ljungdahlii TaxID=1538 RepID=A0A168PJ14_9CLOT|nr:hypothetical protein [Clostridium ljungdahlii]OAA87807.1 hypothetical protein WY13_01922 [Clostridium ljungdahlii]
MNREKLMKIIVYISNILIVISKVELFLCCLLTSIAIVREQVEIVVFLLEMIGLSILTLQISKYLKNYFSRE